MKSMLLPLALLAVPALAEPKADRLTEVLGNKVAGQPRTCLDQLEARNVEVVNGAVLFRQNSRLVYRNDMNGCDILREGDALQPRLLGQSRLCRGDPAEILDRPSSAFNIADQGTQIGKGSCTFGPFVPYRTPR